MRLLIDENLSPRLVTLLAEAFPNSTHVESVQLRGCDDARIWMATRDGGYVIVTKDEDFNARSVLYGAPPKVVHLRVGNVGTDAVAALLLEQAAHIEAFVLDDVTSLLVLP